jgi:Flp pilus assembly protein TadB
MAPNRDQVKNRIKTRDQGDPELDDALQSARVLSDQENLNKKNELARNDSAGKHMHYAQLIGLYVLVFCVTALFVVLAWHYGASANWRFLSPEQQDKLQQFLFSGTVGGVLTGFGKNILK